MVVIFKRYLTVLTVLLISYVINRQNVRLFRQITAGITTAYMLFLLGFLVMTPGINYYTWRYFLETYWMRSVSCLFVWGLCYQSWLSMQGEILNYFRMPHFYFNLFQRFQNYSSVNRYAGLLLGVVWCIYVLYFFLGISIILNM